MRKWIYNKRDGTWSRPVPLSTLMTILGRRVVTGEGPFEIFKSGESIRKNLTRKQALDRLEAMLKRTDIGPVFKVRRMLDDSLVLKVRETEEILKVIDTNGNSKADYFWTIIKGNYPNANWLGSYVCKHIVGTNTLSQHSYGNAVDFSLATMDGMKEAARLIIQGADDLKVAHLILGDRIWTPANGWRYYSGRFHYHIHVDFIPNLSGGCGVKG